MAKEKTYEERERERSTTGGRGGGRIERSYENKAKPEGGV